MSSSADLYYGFTNGVLECLDDCGEHVVVKVLCLAGQTAAQHGPAAGQEAAVLRHFLVTVTSVLFVVVVHNTETRT